MSMSSCSIGKLARHEMQYINIFKHFGYPATGVVRGKTCPATGVVLPEQGTHYPRSEVTSELLNRKDYPHVGADIIHIPRLWKKLSVPSRSKTG